MVWQGLCATKAGCGRTGFFLLGLSGLISAGTSHHTQAQQIAEMHLTKLQEQVSRAEWTGVCVTDMNLLTPHQLVCRYKH